VPIVEVGSGGDGSGIKITLGDYGHDIEVTGGGGGGGEGINRFDINRQYDAGYGYELLGNNNAGTAGSTVHGQILADYRKKGFCIIATAPGLSGCRGATLWINHGIDSSVSGDFLFVAGGYNVTLPSVGSAEVRHYSKNDDHYSGFVYTSASSPPSTKTCSVNKSGQNTTWGFSMAALALDQLLEVLRQISIKAHPGTGPEVVQDLCA
jgi:hypothetical protein